MSDYVVIKVKLDNTDFKKNLEITQTQMNNFSGSVSSAMKKVASAIAVAFAVDKIVDYTTAIAKVGIEYNALKEQSLTTWTTLLGSQDKAIEQLERIEKFAAKTPFSQMGVDTMAKYLHNAGYEGDAVFETLTKIGDMGSAFGVQEDSLVELTRQFSQVQQAGYAYTEDLNILADRGIPIYQAIADTVGVTVAEVKKMASEGKLTSEIYNSAIDSMAEATAGAMDAQSQTFSGMMSTLQDTLTVLAGLLTNKLFGALKGLLEQLLPIVEAFTQTYKESGSLVSALESVGIQTDGLRAIWESFGKIMEIVWVNMVQPVLSAVSEAFSMFGEGVMEIMPTVQNSFSMAFDVMILAMEMFGEIFTDIWETMLKPILDLFIEIILALGEVFADVLPYIQTLWETVLTVMSEVYTGLLRPMFEFIFELVRKLWELFQQYLPEVQRIFQEAIQLMVDVWENNLQPAFESICWFLENVLYPAFDLVFTYLILPIVESVFQTLISLWDNTLKPCFEGITEFIKGVFTGNWKTAWNGVAKIFKGVMDGLVSMAKTPINAVINMINKLIGGLNTLQIPDWVPGIGGKGINIPKIPTLWKGTNFAKGGLTLVGEQGPELVNMNRGASVLPSHKTRSVLDSSKASGSNLRTDKAVNIYVEMDGRTVAKAVGQPLMDTIRMKTGMAL